MKLNSFTVELQNLAWQGAKTSLPFYFTFEFFFRMQNDQPESSSPADSFASEAKYRRRTKMANLLDVAHKNASKCNSIKMLFVR